MRNRDTSVVSPPSSRTVYFSKPLDLMARRARRPGASHRSEARSVVIQSDIAQAPVCYQQAIFLNSTITHATLPQTLGIVAAFKGVSDTTGADVNLDAPAHPSSP